MEGEGPEHVVMCVMSWR